MNNDFPQRKIIRLKKFDYSKIGLYFITICTHNRKAIFAIRSNFEDNKYYSDINDNTVGADSISARIFIKFFEG